MEEHSNLIKEHLKKRGIHPNMARQRAGHEFQHYHAYVCNRKQPNLTIIFKVAELLGVPPKESIK